MRHSHGFTLIELLVVISIIALLIAVLLPALKKARDAAQATQCASNVRQLNLAFNAYSVDNHGYYPPLNLKDNTWNFSWWTNLIVDGAYIHATWESKDYQGYGHINTGVFDCPAVTDQVYANGDDYPAYGVNNTPYWNPDAKTRSWLFGYVALKPGQVTCVRMSDLKRPTQLVVLGDAEKNTGAALRTSIALAWGGPGSWDPGTMASRAAPRHDGNPNLVFFDGHVARINYDQARTNANDIFGYYSW